MRILASGQGERGIEVSLEGRGLLDNRQQLLVNGLLVSDARGINLLFFTFLLFSLLEVSIVELGIKLDRRDISLGLGGNNVGLVDTTERDTVDLERSSDEQETR